MYINAELRLPSHSRYYQTSGGGDVGKILAWEDQNPRCMCVCVMVVTVKMTSRSKESVNTALASVCVSMAFFPIIMFIIWGKECLREQLGTSRDPQALPLSSHYTPTPPNVTRSPTAERERTRCRHTFVAQTHKKSTPTQHPLFPFLA